MRGWRAEKRSPLWCRVLRPGPPGPLRGPAGGVFRTRPPSRLTTPHENAPAEGRGESMIGEVSRPGIERGYLAANRHPGERRDPAQQARSQTKGLEHRVPQYDD